MPNFWKKINKPILALAPMAGYTDSAFRQICKYYGADVVYSEMASATALNFKGKKTLELLKFKKAERYYIVQLFGNDPKYFKNAAQVVSEKIKPDGIDINMGCPVKKVFSNGSGAALMLNPERAREIIKQTLIGTDLPVSIKIRSKVNKTTAYKFVKKIKDLKIVAIMIHGRSMKQGFSGKIDYSQIKKVKSLYRKAGAEEDKKLKATLANVAFNFLSSSAPIIIANGGINTPEDAIKMIKKTGADGVGIARGALTKPWLFAQTKEFLRRGEYKKFGLSEIKKAALKHAKMSSKNNGKHGIIEMRKYLLWYFRGFEGAKEIRKDLVRVESVGDIERVLERI
ncbi:tRNA-dihydrouridine synthase [Candidatus Parcubacteria bacterium]|nr:tRNA-dihydrouridine synthase [Candidatus Parcubacteria bacterium]